jgi:hypothetical protein
MGLFFDSSPVLLNNPPLSLESRQRISPNAFGMTLLGNPGQRFVIEASTDLVQWAPISTNTLEGISYWFQDPIQGLNRRFYRAISAP